MSLMSMLPATVSAKGWGSISLGDSTSDPSSALGKPLGVLVAAIQVIGFVILIYGFYDVISSFISNSGEVKAKGIATIVIGVILTAMRSVLQQCGIIE